MTTRTDAAPVGKLAYSLAEAAAAIGVSKRQVERLRADGRLRVKQLDGRVVIRDRDLQAFLDGLPDA